MRFNSYKRGMVEVATDTSEPYIFTGEQLSELKSVLLDMALDVIRVCEANQIRVLFGGGSALGAVRHKGFIPWDDDLDLLMPRDDFNRFCSVFETMLGEKYELVAPNVGERHKDRFPKIMKIGTVMKAVGDNSDKFPCGVFLDVFLLENIPKNKFLRYMKGFLCTGLMYLGSRVYMFENDNVILRTFMCQTEAGARVYWSTYMIGKFFSFISSKMWFEWIDRAVQYHRETGLLGIPTGRKHYFGEILPASVYLPPSKGIFEGKEVPLPADCDAYLKNLYGDYMQVPPPEKREKHYIVELKL